MAKSDLLKQAIADAKTVKETALANAKIALQEAFTPRIKEMLANKLTTEIEGEDEGDMDASMDADVDLGSSDLQPIDRIRLWVGLTPDQFTDLKRKGKASPPKGDRFGLRLKAIPALLRAHLFQGGDYHAKQIIAVVVEFTAIGYLTLEILAVQYRF